MLSYSTLLAVTLTYTSLLTSGIHAANDGVSTYSTKGCGDAMKAPDRVSIFPGKCETLRNVAKCAPTDVWAGRETRCLADVDWKSGGTPTKAYTPWSNADTKLYKVVYYGNDKRACDDASVKKISYSRCVKGYKRFFAECNGKESITFKRKNGDNGDTQKLGACVRNEKSKYPYRKLVAIGSVADIFPSASMSENKKTAKDSSDPKDPKAPNLAQGNSKDNAAPSMHENVISLVLASLLFQFILVL